MDLFYRHTFTNLRDVYTGMPIRINAPWWEADFPKGLPRRLFVPSRQQVEIRRATMLEF